MWVNAGTQRPRDVGKSAMRLSVERQAAKRRQESGILSAQPTRSAQRSQADQSSFLRWSRSQPPVSVARSPLLGYRPNKKPVTLCTIGERCEHGYGYRLSLWCPECRRHGEVDLGALVVRVRRERPYVRLAALPLPGVRHRHRSSADRAADAERAPADKGRGRARLSQRLGGLVRRVCLWAVSGPDASDFTTPACDP